MKKFLTLVGINCILLVIFLEIASFFILTSWNFFSRRLSWYGIAQYDRDLEHPIGSDTLVIGCSVAKQLFPFRKKRNVKAMSVVDLPLICYVNISKAIKSNPGLKTIIVLTIPNCFAQKFESKYTYNLFVKPYYTLYNLPCFDLYVHRKLAQNPRALLSALFLFKVLPLPDINFEKELPYNYNEFSEFSERYIKKVKELCDRNGIRLIFLASPVSETFMKDTRNCIPLREDIERKGYVNVFSGYFESIVIFPDSCFGTDGTHFRHEYVEKHRSDILDKLKLTHI